MTQSDDTWGTKLHDEAMLAQIDALFKSHRQSHSASSEAAGRDDQQAAGRCLLGVHQCCCPLRPEASGRNLFARLLARLLGLR